MDEQKPKLTLEELTTVLDSLWSKSLTVNEEEKRKLKQKAKGYAKLYAELNPSGYRPSFCR